jgi:hypothetical protein
MNLPLRNNTKEIVGHSKVSPQDFEHLNGFKWSLGRGYAIGKISGKTWLLHRYIKEKLENLNIDHKIIDHVNSDRLDNTRENIVISNYLDNNRKATKMKNTSSIYTGVSKHFKLWITQLQLEKKTLYGSYYNEKHAAHQYNLWLTEYNLVGNRNDIEEKDIIDFVPYVKPTYDLPTGVNMTPSGFMVKIKSKYYGSFKKLEEYIR